MNKVKMNVGWSMKINDSLLKGSWQCDSVEELQTLLTNIKETIKILTEDHSELDQDVSK